MDKKKSPVFIVLTIIGVIFLVGGSVYGLARYLGNKKLQENVENYIKKNQLQNEVSIEDYSYEPLSGKITFKNIKLNRYTPFGADIHIKELKILEYTQPEGYTLPTRIKMKATGITLEEDASHHSYSLYQEVYYDPEKSKYLLKKLHIEGNGFSLKISATFSNVKKDFLTVLSENQTEINKLLDVIPESAVLQYSDYGFLKELDNKNEITQKVKKIISETDNEKLRDILKAILLISKKGEGQITVEFKNHKNLTLRQILFIYLLSKTFQTDKSIFRPEEYIDIKVIYRGNA